MPDGAGETRCNGLGHQSRLIGASLTGNWHTCRFRAPVPGRAVLHRHHQFVLVRNYPRVARQCPDECLLGRVHGDVVDRDIEKDALGHVALVLVGCAEIGSLSRRTRGRGVVGHAVVAGNAPALVVDQDLMRDARGCDKYSGEEHCQDH